MILFRRVNKIVRCSTAVFFSFCIRLSAANCYLVLRFVGGCIGYVAQKIASFRYINAAFSKIYFDLMLSLL